MIGFLYLLELVQRKACLKYKRDTDLQQTVLCRVQNRNSQIGFTPWLFVVKTTKLAS
jgi:hypothetical protein